MASTSRFPGTRNQLRRLVAVGVVATTSVLGIVGCSKSPGLDVAEAEKMISAELRKAYDPVEVGATECPDKVSADKDTTVECSTAIGEDSVRVEVTTTDDRGDIAFVTLEAVLDVAAVELDLETKLHAAYDEPGDVLEVEADCGEPQVRVLPAKSTFLCEVTVAAEQITQEVTVEDTVGNLSYRAVTP